MFPMPKSKVVHFLTKKTPECREHLKVFKSCIVNNVIIIIGESIPAKCNRTIEMLVIHSVFLRHPFDVIAR